ncbi:hypothetical protein H0H87_005319 [Tephrocybe sp. NHM501043]|nr:hypothetical protein H0H87_005319 [Tephrocybe sp. NHM501043]
MVGMYLANRPATVAAVDVVTQLATLTPLLIIVRVGFGLTHGNVVNVGILSSNTSSSVAHSIPDGSGIHVTTSVEYALSPQPKGKGTSYA